MRGHVQNAAYDIKAVRNNSNATKLHAGHCFGVKRIGAAQADETTAPFSARSQSKTFEPCQVFAR